MKKNSQDVCEQDQDTCANCAHNAADHTLSDESQPGLEPLYACRVEGCECDDLRRSP
jgi:hypothetical protein